MNTAKVSLVPLQHASLCLDCDMITGAHTQCFVCGSAALLNLARILDGEESARSERAVFTAVTMRAQNDSYAPEVASRGEARLIGRFASEARALPRAGSESLESSRKPEHRTWRRPLRSVAAIMHRSMTSALLAASVLSFNPRTHATQRADGYPSGVPQVISDRAPAQDIKNPSHR